MKKTTDKLLVWVPVNTETGKLHMKSLKLPEERRGDIGTTWQWKQFRLVPSAPAKAMPPPTEEMAQCLRKANMIDDRLRVSPGIWERHRNGLKSRGLIDRDGYLTEAGLDYLKNHP